MGKLKSIQLICKNCKRKYNPDSHYKQRNSYFCSRKCQHRFISNKNHPNWKGDNVSYKSLHQWVRRHKLKPEVCEECNKNKSYDIANISGKYKRDIHDYQWLCRSCHKNFDRKIPQEYYQAQKLFNNNISISQIAQQLNLHFSTIYRWKNGRYYGLQAWLPK